MTSSDIAAAVAASMRTERKIAHSLNEKSNALTAGPDKSPAPNNTPATNESILKDTKKTPSTATNVKKRRRGPTPSSNWKKLRATLDAEPRRGRPPNFKKRPRTAKNTSHPNKKPEKSDPSPVPVHSAFTRGSVAAEDGKLTKLLALDCEMVGTGPSGRDDALARVSIVNSNGDVVYDTFVRVREPVTDYRTAFSGVTAADVAPDAPGAEDLPVARKRVMELLRGRIVVGHALKNDFRAIGISHPWKLTRDTAVYFKALWKEQLGRRSAAPPKLATLVAQVLGVDEFQKSSHDSCEDARAALALYKKFGKEWEAGLVKGKAVAPGGIGKETKR